MLDALSNSLFNFSTCALTTISTAVTSPLAFLSRRKEGSACMSNLEESSYDRSVSMRATAMPSWLRRESRWGVMSLQGADQLCREGYLLKNYATTTPPFLKMNSTSYWYVLTSFCIYYMDIARVTSWMVA
jgi:hypothetical protein